MCHRSLRSLFVTVIILLLLSSLLAIPSVKSQDPEPSPTPVSAVDRVELHQALLDLTNPWTVMCVAAHPDDEDGTTLTVLRRKYGVHTVSLFSTYGEGGQNAIGPELYEELGVIREEETRRAAKIQGSEPYFLGLKDFGFSKSAEEAFRFWRHDEALRRMVLKIRELRPDVIITNHNTTSGHGHHQATGRLALEAFEAAADPQRFPEQLSKAGVWQVKRLFVRYRRPSGEATSSVADEQLVVVDPNEIDPIRNVSYGELALKALQQHTSQGPWPESVSAWLRAQNNQTGKLNLVRYQLIKESSGTSPLATGGVPFVNGLKLPEDVAQSLATPPGLTIANDNQEALLEALIKWRKSISQLSKPDAERHRFALIEARLNEALAVASVLSLSVTAAAPVLIPGAKNRITVSLANQGTRIFTIHRLTLDPGNGGLLLDAAEHILPGTETTVTTDLVVPKTATLTVPKSEHLYDGTLNGKALIAEADVEIEGGGLLKLRAALNLDVAPAVELKSVMPNPYVWTPGTINKPINFQVELNNNSPEPFRGILKLASPAIRIFEFGKDVSLQPLLSQSVSLQVNAVLNPRMKRRTPNGGAASLSVVRSGTGESITQRDVPVVYIDARVRPSLRVGYIPSFDRTLEMALAALGVDAKSLSAEEMKSSDLSVYDTIVIDNRGYEARPELVENNARLLEFVNDGGTLLVFYQREDWNADERRGRPQLAPYPIVLGNDRVTEEDAAVRFRLPRHRLLNYPNRISQRDFEGWIQERGLYFPKEWDPKYMMLFSMHDTGEKPLYGGLLVTKYGKGNYIYTSMVWYRQLRAGVPGGYRMFANLISY